MTRRLALLSSLLASAWLASAAPTEQDAQSAAERWLALIDNGQYAASWIASGKMFQSNITQPAWVEMVTKVRGPLGPLASARGLSKVTLTKSLPGAPDGEYAVVQFRSSFEKKAEAIETVTLSSEEGMFKAVGYFIK